MRQMAMAGAMVVAGSGAPAAGQVDGTATWVWDVVTENGDAVVEPGETATVTLAVDMAPDVGFPRGPVLGLSLAEFDTLGGQNATNGSIAEWALAYPFDELVGDGDKTTTDGVSLFGTFVGQNPVQDVYSSADPIDILEFVWEPSVGGEYEVGYATATESIYVWEGSIDDGYQAFAWSIVEGDVAFEVVPGPATGVLVAGGWLGLLRRRRGQSAQTTAVCVGCRERAGSAGMVHRFTRHGSTLAAGLLCACAPCLGQSGEVAIVNGEVFEGPTQTGTGESLPPDCSIAVSPSWVVAINNGKITALDRTSNPPFQRHDKDESTFWGGGHDPRVVWDPRDGPATSQFVASIKLGMKVAYAEPGEVLPFGTAGTGNSAWFADTDISQIADFDCAESYAACLDGDMEEENLSIDRPTLGFDDQAWYVSAPSIDIGDTDRINNFFYIINKNTDGQGQLIRRVYSNNFLSESGGPLCCFDLVGAQSERGREVAFAATHDSQFGAPEAGYFCGVGAFVTSTLDYEEPTCPSGQSYLLRLYAIVDPLDDVDRELRYYELPVDCFDADKIDVPTGNPETRRLMGGGDGRITGAFWHELDGDGLLYVVHSVNEPVVIEGVSHDRKEVRWYIIETNGWPVGASKPAIRYSGQIDGGTIVDEEDNEWPVHLITPAITANEAGDAAIVACRTSVVEPPAIVATGRFEFDLDGEVFDLYEVEDSDSNAVPDPPRWGDYSGVAPDPDDGLRFWGFGEYTAANGEWATQIFHFKLEPLP